MNFILRRNRKGFSLIDTMFAVALSGIIAIGVLGAMRHTGDPLVKSRLEATAITVRAKMIRLLSRYSSWYYTAVLNYDFICAVYNSPACTANGNFQIFDDNGNVYYDPTDTTWGYKLDGTDCFVDSGTAPNYKCPIRVDLGWEPVGDTTVAPATIRIIGTISTYNSATKTVQTRGNLGFTITKNFYSSDCTLNGATILNNSGLRAYRDPSGNTAGDCSVYEYRLCAMGTLTGSYTYSSCACDLPWGGTLAANSSTTAYSNNTSATCASLSSTKNCGDNTGVLDAPAFIYPSCQSTAVGCALPWGGTIANGANVTAYSTSVSTNCAGVSQTRSCAAGVLSGTFTKSSCTTCTGTVFGGYCWHTGQSASCSSVCGSYGGCNLAGIVRYGAGGTDTDCKNLILGLGLTLPSGTAGQAVGNSGCMYDSTAQKGYRETGETKCSSAVPYGLTALCSCNN